MFFTTVVAAALAGSALAAPIAPRKATPSGYASGYLEDYNTYHLRYIALDCQDQHNTTFFDDCCHPLLASESLSSRPSYCTPNATEIASASSYIATEGASSTSSYVAAAATASVSASVDDSTEEYCSTEETSTSAPAAAAYTPASSSSAAATTSSAAVANDYAHAKASTTTSTSEWVAPTTTSSSTKAAATTSSSSSGSSGSVETGGYATYFYQGGVAGECGTVHSDSDYVIAIDKSWWPDYMTNSNSALCGKSITLTNTNNGKSTTATVADVCPTCDTDNSLDLSVAAFQAIASESDGMVPITWYWS